MDVGRSQISGRLAWDLPMNMNPLMKEKDNPESSECLLELACFVKTPRMCFENVKIGSSRTQHLTISNPGNATEKIELEKFPQPETGFSIEGMQDEGLLSIELEPQQQILVPITWQPTVAGNSRHVVVFKWIGGQKLQVVILASSIDPNAGKKKKVKRKSSVKSLKPSNKENIIQKRNENDKLTEINVNQHATPEKSHLKKIVEILPDTPSRRQTFTVIKPKNDKYNDEKENRVVCNENFGSREGTFHISRQGNEDVVGTFENTKTSFEYGNAEIKGNENCQQVEVKNEQFTKETDNFTENFTDTAVFDSNTFHESEIRLSSSPIKFSGRTDCFPTMKPNSDLNPGQVVLNGEVKHQFIPYPSFNNTDTFWNIEMSTEAKSKANYDDSLSFGSAASSLFTITREERFSPHLETVSEASVGTSKNSTSTTLTNENCNDVQENVVWLSEQSDQISLCETADTLRASDVFMRSGANSSEVVSAENKDIDVSNALGNVTDDAENKFVQSYSPKIGVDQKEAADEEEAIESRIFSQREAQISLEDSLEAQVLAKQDMKSEISPQKVASVVADELKSVVDSQNKMRGSALISQIVLRSENQPDEEPRAAAVVESSVVSSNNKCTQNQPTEPVASSKILERVKQKNNDKISTSKVVESRYLKAQIKNQNAGKTGTKPAKEFVKKERNIIDAKFKSIVLPKKRKSDAGNSTKSIVKPSLAVKKLKLVKPVSKMPRHPMPYAARNMFYDERWIEKQERGFKNWLNYVLTPPDDDDESEVEPKKGNIILESDTSQPVAPTKEALSLRMYAARRRMAKLRRAACALYQSDKNSSVICKVEREIEHGRLAIRADRHVDADLGVRKHITDMLMSFNSLWLRIGLEVVFGEIIPMQSNNDITSLSRFIQRRLLANPDIAAEYSHPSVPGLFKPGYVETLAKFTLKKLLLVIIFVDCAKNSRLISHDPCLFRKDAEFKAIRDMLLCFSRNYLHREGDLVKHLTYLGYAVSHCQTALQEYDFGVNNLAVDLRDGLRLVRVVELLTKNWNLSSRLRVPAVSRLQKVHNVGIALQGLKEHEFDQNGQIIDPKYIVDGHREKTLLLLWQIIFHFQVDLLLDEGKLQDEIKHLEKCKMLKIESKHMAYNPDSTMDKKRQSLDTSVYFKSNKLSLLLRWCKLVCVLHDIKIENFTVSFSDGRALCCLLHHYHPTLLSKEMINNETSVTCGTSIDPDEDIDDELVYENWTQCFSPSTGVNRKLERLLQNEKQNFSTFSDKVKEIGGGPAMIFASDMSNTIPDEKVVIAFLSFLCSRLLDIREEIRAARCIQTVWRQYRMRKEKQKYKAFTAAATNLQAFARGFLVRQRVEKMKSACVKIQACWRSYIARKKASEEATEMLLLKKQDAATKLQAIARGFLHRSKLQRQKQAAMVLQSFVRGFLLRKRLSMMNESARIIQQKYRAWKYAKITRNLFLAKRNAVVKIQRLHRKHRELVAKKQSKNAIVIQSFWKMYEQRKRFLRQKEASIIIQKYTRSYIFRNDFLKRKQAVGILQARLRAYLCGQSIRYSFVEKRQAAIKIQRAYRDFAAKRRERRLKAVVCLQASWRMMSQKNRYISLKKAAMFIQARFRGRIARRKHMMLLKTVVIIQKRFRAMKQAREIRYQFQRLRDACVMVQARVRSMKFRRRYACLRAQVVKVQAVYRGKRCRESYLQLKAATVLLQRRFRAVVRGKTVRKELGQVRDASVAIQAWYRGNKQRQRYVQLRAHVCKMQAMFKGKKTREEFLTLKESVVLIQRHFRAAIAGTASRRRYLQQKNACITIQAWFKCNKQHQRYKTMKKAAILIQRNFRKYAATKRYQELRSAALLIQTRYRALRVAQATQIHYLITKGAAITIQSVYRGYQARKQLNQRHAAATLIQAAIRMKLARKNYLKLRYEVCCIQDNFRAITHGRKQAMEYQNLKRSTLVLQAAFRGYCVRKEIDLMSHAAIKFQATFRAYIERSRYASMIKAAVKIQTCYRRYRAQIHYNDIRHSAVMIQRVYRGHMLTKKASNDFIMARKSAIRIQATFRAYIERSRYARMIKAAVKIQTCYRRYRAGIHYNDIRHSAVMIQRVYRGHMLTKKASNDFIMARNSAIKIQATFRAYMERSRYARMIKAAVKIQTCYRRYRAEIHYNDIRHSAVMIQRFYRGYRLTKQASCQFQNIRNSAVKIQAVFKGYTQRKRFVYLRNGVVKLQRCWRGYLENKTRNAAAVTLQNRWMAYRLGKTTRAEFIRQRIACVLIQNTYRKHKCMREFTRVKKAVITIQKRYRAHQAMLAQRRCFSTMIRSVIAIQATYKMYASKKMYIATKSAALRIQKTFREYLHAKRQDDELRAAVIIQRYWRGYLLTRKLRTEFLMKRQAAIVLQSVFRGLSARKRLVQVQQAVVVVQTWFRMIIAKRNFNRKRDAAILIQRHFRAYVLGTVASANYHVMRGALITLQAGVRGYCARKQYQRERKLIVRLQASVRMFVCRKRYEEMRRVTISMQQRARANAIGVATRKEYLMKRDALLKIQRWFRRLIELKNAVVMIQSTWRMHVARKDYKTKKEACIKIQAVVRRFIAERKYLLYQGAALVIQRCFRAYLIGSLERLRYQHAKHACIRIQACVRMFLCRRRYLEMRTRAIRIQQRYRAQTTMKMQRKRYFEAKSAVLKIQSAYRGHKARLYAATLKKQKMIEHYRKLVKEQQILISQRLAAVVIQKNYRRAIQRQNYHTVRSAVIQIQRYYRSHKQVVAAREQFVAQKRSAVVIQRGYRMYKAKKLLQNLKRERDTHNRSATVIQRNFKRFAAQTDFLNKKRAAVKIQAVFRGRLFTRRLRSEFVAKRQSAVTVQCAYRAYRSRQVLKRLTEEKSRQLNAAVTVQKFVKGYLARERYLQFRQATVKLQMLYRSKQLTKVTREDFVKKRMSAVVIQSAYRVYSARKLLDNLRYKKLVEEASAVKIQNVFRAYAEMKKQKEVFVMKRKAAIVIQRAYRAYFERHMAAYNKAAVTIQSRFKGYIQLKRYREMRNAACLIQLRIRDILRRMKDAREEQAAISLQRWYRSISLMKKQRGKFKRIRSACLLIQSVYRGYKVRSKIADRKLIKAIKRIEVANSEATESKKLSNRTASALSYLLNCKYWTTIFDALKNLEVGTRLSYVCCEKLIADNALGIIFQIVQKCNRGLPSIGIIEMAASIVLNLAKCPSTYKYVFEEKDCIEIMIDLMTKYREKKTPIFIISAMSLDLLCKDASIAREIKNNETVMKKLKSFHNMARRKAEFESKRKNHKNKAKDTEHIFDQFTSVKKLMGTLGCLRDETV